ncbi:ATP-binding protein [Streptomyces sp. NPDC060194]|uniref:ATP-binding protein n=1 Tax=Streptomyces sp. NPDC060194 TaxID=3347069 RepID=UPI00364613CC
MGCPASAAEARAAIFRLLREQAEPCDPTTEADVLLVVSELVANSQRHAGDRPMLYAFLFSGVLDVTVADGVRSGPDDPDQENRPFMTAGFGWPLVNQLADLVLVTRPLRGGKRIRVQMTL